MIDTSTVILPKWVFKPNTKEEQNSLVQEYISKRYPGYRVIEFSEYYCICEIMR